ncbi:hypothetical protein FACS1894110_26010 [Spirochaetia bacterium]|nr:hypothetical protein FACS1894110_26010 [Spirochaetia bacterium]
MKKYKPPLLKIFKSHFSKHLYGEFLDQYKRGDITADEMQECADGFLVKPVLVWIDRDTLKKYKSMGKHGKYVMADVLEYTIDSPETFDKVTRYRHAESPKWTDKMIARLRPSHLRRPDTPQGRAVTISTTATASPYPRPIASNREAQDTESVEMS